MEPGTEENVLNAYLLDVRLISMYEVLIAVTSLGLTPSLCYHG